MAENTFNTSITEEDPFNEDEVRSAFWRQSETTCWKLAFVVAFSSICLPLLHGKLAFKIKTPC